MKLKSKGKWKSIPLSQSFYSQGDEFSCLGGIEELTDYSYVTKGSVSGKVVKKNVNAKKETILPPVKKVATPDKKAEKRKAQKTTNEEVIESKKLKKNEAKKVTDDETIESKKLKKNVFTVTDINDDNNKDKEATPKNKKKKQKKENKSTINLEIYNKLCGKEVTTTESCSSKKEDSESDIKAPAPVIKPTESESIVQSEEMEESSPKTPKVTKKKKKSKPKSQKVDNSTKRVPVELSAMTAWKELFVRDDILLGLAEKGFVTPTPIQRMTLPAALRGRRDIVGAAETGSGKTLAFGIPIIQGILEQKNEEDLDDVQETSSSLPTQEEMFEMNKEDKEEELIDEDDDEKIGCVSVVDDIELDFDIVEDKEDKIEDKKQGGQLQALILTPTRELAIQVRDHLVVAAKYTNVGVTVVVGGMSVEKQIRLLNRRPAIVVATPGRFWDVVKDGHPHLADLAKIRYLAIDETDRMVEKGHFAELQNILEVVNSKEENKEKRQTFVMSATLSMVHKPPAHGKKKNNKQMTGPEKLKELVKEIGIKDKPKIVDITRKVGTAETLTESVLYCSLTEKDNYLYYFITAHPGRTVVFCNSIDCVRRLGNLFKLLDVNILPLHAQLHQKHRLKNLDKFVADSNSILVATDVAARGLDIPEIQHVVHYQVPRTSESYVHRSGRTARASREGLSLMLIDPSEQALVRRHCGNLARTTDIPTFPVDGKRLDAVGERIKAARKLDKLLLQTRKENAGMNWKAKAAEDADLIISDSEDEDGENQRKQMERKQDVKITTKILKNMLAVPLTTKEFSGKYPTMTGQLVLPGENNEGAVDALRRDIKETGELLKGNVNKNKNTNRFKGFKKKKKNGKSS